MLSSASRDPPPSILLSSKPAVSFILGAVLLCYLVQSHYQHDVCLHALRVYSFAVIGLEICFRILGVCVLTGGGGSSDSYLGGPSKGKTKKSSKVVDVFLIAVWSVLSIILTHIVTVLYGAYLIEYVEETFTFSILVAALSFIRPLIALGPSAIVIILERLNWEKESEVHCFAVLLGAWLGAIPIPLDWDTPWQVWPLTCSIGAVLGELGACMYLLVKLWKEGDISRKKNKAT